MARPTYEPTENERKMVKQASALGLRQQDIVRLVLTAKGQPITEKTLRKYYKEELATGRVQAHLQILSTAFQIATNPKHPKCATMNIWTQKSQMGINETYALEHSGPDGKPLIQTPMLTVICPKE